jgi:hypothetical protein
MPVTVVTGQAGGLSGDDRSALALPDSRQQLAQAWALWEAGATAPHIVVEHDDLGKAEAACVIGQRLLPALALVMGAYLMASRLAHIDIGRAVPMRGTHLVAHACSPRGARRA